MVEDDQQVGGLALNDRSDFGAFTAYASIARPTICLQTIAVGRASPRTKRLNATIACAAFEAAWAIAVVKTLNTTVGFGIAALETATAIGTARLVGCAPRIRGTQATLFGLFDAFVADALISNLAVFVERTLDTSVIFTPSRHALRRLGERRVAAFSASISDTIGACRSVIFDANGILRTGCGSVVVALDAAIIFAVWIAGVVGLALGGNVSRKRDADTGSAHIVVAVRFQRIVGLASIRKSAVCIQTGYALAIHAIRLLRIDGFTGIGESAVRFIASYAFVLLTIGRCCRTIAVECGCCATVITLGTFIIVANSDASARRGGCWTRVRAFGTFVALTVFSVGCDITTVA